MNLLYSVGKSAPSEPRCVIVEYKGDPNSDKFTHAIVGKGVTFDTGGLNLKPTGHIENMHLDKCGSCQTIAALSGAIDMGLKKNVIFCVGLVENSIDANSYKPGDIISSMKGITVEVTNTDAEGRLVLADALTYVQKTYKPEKVIDLATLTGGVIVALGYETAGTFTNDKDFLKDLHDAGKEYFEEMWELPINKETHELLKSKVADMTNSARGGTLSASQGAAFLSKFIEKDVKWIHLDIAGTGMPNKPNPPVSGEASGWGVHTLLNYLRK